MAYDPIDRNLEIPSLTFPSGAEGCGKGVGSGGRGHGDARRIGWSRPPLWARMVAEEAPMPQTPAPDPLAEALSVLRGQKKLAERAIAQVPDGALGVPLGPEENSIAVIVQHIAGNQLSRWTDFLTSDGEKPDRDREREFEERGLSRAELLALWERGWTALFSALEPLTAADLGRIVAIRGEPHTVLRAVMRQLSHYAQHVGQIVFLARHHAGDHWQSLSIPRGGTAAFNRAMEEKHGTKKGAK